MADGLKNLFGVSYLTVNLSSDETPNPLDTALYGLMLVDCRVGKHPELQRLLQSDYAYVQQYFYYWVAKTRNRMQIAHGYNTNRMATRHYYEGKWSAWELVDDGCDAATVGGKTVSVQSSAPPSPKTGDLWIW